MMGFEGFVGKKKLKILLIQHYLILASEIDLTFLESSIHKFTEQKLSVYECKFLLKLATNCQGKSLRKIA